MAHDNLPGPVDDDRPYIGGFCFCETAGYSLEQANRMAATGKVFVTDFMARATDGRIARYGGTLIAEDWDAAREEAARRGLGETIAGVLHGIGSGRMPRA